MDADPRLTEIQAKLTAYRNSGVHLNGFACCTAHAVADEVPFLLGEVRQLAAELQILEKALGLNEAPV